MPDDQQPARGERLGGAVTPPRERYITSYYASEAYEDEAQFPPALSGVTQAIDILCHAHQGPSDALGFARYAAQSGMQGILFRTIAGADRPAEAARWVQTELETWCRQEGLTPIRCWAAYSVAETLEPASASATREQLEDGVAAVWLPSATHASTLSKVGGRKRWWDPAADEHAVVPPLSWEQARQAGHVLLDERGKLDPEIRELLRLVAEYDRAVCFGHATHPEMYALAEEADRLGLERAVVDYPFSPLVDLSIEQMQELAAAGIFLNFTYEELSPFLGVDPLKMAEAIRAVGVEHVVISTGAGEPLLPNPVEAMRLMRAYMRAFGLSDDEVKRISALNPARIVGASAEPGPSS